MENLYVRDQAQKDLKQLEVALMKHRGLYECGTSGYSNHWIPYQTIKENLEEKHSLEFQQDKFTYEELIDRIITLLNDKETYPNLRVTDISFMNSANSASKSQPSADIQEFERGTITYEMLTNENTIFYSKTP